MIGINPTVLVMKYLNSQVSRDAIQAVGDYLNSKESYSQRFKIKKTHNDLKKKILYCHHQQEGIQSHVSG